MIIREVQLSDAYRIAEIYNYYIENTIVTFEETKISEEAMSQKMQNILSKAYPFIVCEEEDQIIGYAYISTWRYHSAYNITLETSIYFDTHFTGKGLGSALYSELIKSAKAINIHSLIGVMSLPNESSRRLHEKMGFRRVGNVKEAGNKLGRLIDVEFWQKIID
jgi:phosphinothricin acetyltransferase